MSSANEPSSAVAAPVQEETQSIDLRTEFKNLQKSDQLYIKRLEAINRARVKKQTLIRRRTFFMGVSLLAGVVGIYAYTMGAIKQEKFLEDFEPAIAPSQREASWAGIHHGPRDIFMSGLCLWKRNASAYLRTPVWIVQHLVVVHLLNYRVGAPNVWWPIVLLTLCICKQSRNLAI